MQFHPKLAGVSHLRGLDWCWIKVCAEVKVAGEHLRLFSERSPLRVQASIYNVNAKNWIAASETVDDIEEGKERPAAHAPAYLRRVANSELSLLNWKESRSV